VGKTSSVEKRAERGGFLIFIGLLGRGAMM
jgi:hypothetical protein